MPTDDEKFHFKMMRRTLALARRGAGRVSPNPMVGCLIVREGAVLGRGCHLYEKRRHAETLALEAAGAKARGSDLYVNLEPCSHHGRTPPCVDRIIEAGVRRVFAAVRDPNPQVSGKGVRKLRAAGIEVHEGLCGEMAAALNEKFFHFMRRCVPFTTLKLAMTLDGKIAARGGDPEWITGERARMEGHRLRYEHDAILVGVQTVLKDDPSLDVRWRRRNSIVKVVLDSRLRTSPAARLFQSGDPVVIFHSADASGARRRKLSRRAALHEVLRQGDGLDWDRVLKTLGAAKITSMLIEGGSRIAASALRAGAVQRVHFFYAPKILGGRHLSGIADLGANSLGEALRLDSLKMRRLGTDFSVEGILRSG